MVKRVEVGSLVPSNLVLVLQSYNIEALIVRENILLDLKHSSLVLILLMEGSRGSRRGSPFERLIDIGTLSMKGDSTKASKNQTTQKIWMIIDRRETINNVEGTQSSI